MAVPFVLFLGKRHSQRTRPAYGDQSARRQSYGNCNNF